MGVEGIRRAAQPFDTRPVDDQGDDRPSAERFDAAARANRASDEAPPAAPVAARSEDGEVAAHEVALDIAQLTLDIAGIVDPTPISDGSNAIISLCRGDLVGAGISTVSIIPYAGDLAKLAKLERLGKTLDGVAALVRTNPQAAATLRAPLEGLQALLDRVPLDSLPEPTQASVRALQGKLDEALVAVGRADEAPSAPAAEASTPTGAADSGGEGTSGAQQSGPTEGAQGAAAPRATTSPERREHILAGDQTGGGHRPGTGIPGKSEFPAGWSDDKIMHEVESVADDPASTRSTQPNGRIRVEGTRDGVDIRVILQSDGTTIWTAHPTNMPKNP